MEMNRVPKNCRYPNCFKCPYPDCVADRVFRGEIRRNEEAAGLYGMEKDGKRLWSTEKHKNAVCGDWRRKDAENRSTI